MTDEEKANVYHLNNVTSEEVYYHAGMSEKVRQAYLDGLAEGRKEEHDKWCSNPFWVIQLENENAELKKDKEYLDKVNNEQTKVILKLQERIREVENDSNNCYHWNYERIKELEKQIEKMKCCGNCKWYRVENGGETYCDCVGDCIDFDKWELAE